MSRLFGPIHAGAALLLLSPAPAVAHHVVSDYGIAWSEPVSVLETDLQTAAFRLGERRGQWFLVAPSLEYAFIERFSAALRLPFAWIAYDDEDDAIGFGDAEVGAKFRLVSTPQSELILSVGSSIELPTGNADNGLGSGHFEVTPYVTASSVLVDSIVLHALVADRISLVGGHDHDQDEAAYPGSVLSPHREHELLARLGAAYIFDPLYVSGGSEVVVVWSGGETLGPVLLRAESGWLPIERLRIAFGGDVPIAGEERFSWRIRLGAAWMF